MRYAAPVLVDDLRAPLRIEALSRISRRKTGDGKMNFDEIALQRIIDLAPHALPVREIEPAFADLRSVCQELPLNCGGRVGYVVNLLANPDGRICLVECKLWQNSESEREVVAQVLDYAAALAALEYEELAEQVRRAIGGNGAADPLVSRVLGQDPDEDERLAFIAGVQRSLQAGNFLLLIVGDRIRPGSERMAGLLQDRATLGFAFGLVEMAIYSATADQGPYFVQPRVLLRTEIVTRTVFITESREAKPMISYVEPAGKSSSLSEQEFFGDLATLDASIPDRVRELLDRCRVIGCETRLLRRYNIYVDDRFGGVVNVGSIGRDGTVEIWGVASRDNRYSRPIGKEYLESIARLLPGGSVKGDLDNPAMWHVRVNDRVRVPVHLLLDQIEGWLAAISKLQAGLELILEERAARHALSPEGLTIVWPQGKRPAQPETS